MVRWRRQYQAKISRCSMTRIREEKTRCFQSQRYQAPRKYYRQRWHWFRASHTLLKLELTMFCARKSGDTTVFSTLRRNWPEVLNHEKRPSFNGWLEETVHSKDIKMFYDKDPRRKTPFCSIRKVQGPTKVLPSQMALVPTHPHDT